MMTEDFIEKDCVVTHNGITYRAGGALVTDLTMIGYLLDDPNAQIITDWHGQRLGTYQIVSSWYAHRNRYQPVSERVYQIVVTLDDGRRYTGRSGGRGMIYRGKRLAADIQHNDRTAWNRAAANNPTTGGE